VVPVPGVGQVGQGLQNTWGLEEEEEEEEEEDDDDDEEEEAEECDSGEERMEEEHHGKEASREGLFTKKKLFWYHVKVKNATWAAKI